MGDAKRPRIIGGDVMLARFLTEDRVFGYMAPFTLDEFFDEAELAKRKATVTGATAPIAVVGVARHRD